MFNYCTLPPSVEYSFALKKTNQTKLKADIKHSMFEHRWLCILKHSHLMGMSTLAMISNKLYNHANHFKRGVWIKQISLGMKIL